MKKSHVNVIERDKDGNVTYDSRTDPPRREQAPVTAAGTSSWKPLAHPTRRTPTEEELELKAEHGRMMDSWRRGGMT